MAECYVSFARLTGSSSTKAENIGFFAFYMWTLMYVPGCFSLMPHRNTVAGRKPLYVSLVYETQKKNGAPGKNKGLADKLPFLIIQITYECTGDIRCLDKLQHSTML